MRCKSEETVFNERKNPLKIKATNNFVPHLDLTFLIAERRIHYAQEKDMDDS